MGEMPPIGYLSGADVLHPDLSARREVMLRGSGLGTIWPHLVVLLGFTVVMLGLNVVALKKYRRL